VYYSNFVHTFSAVMKNINPLGLFDEHILLERLTKLKDPLVKLEVYIDWNIFAPILNIVFSKPESSSTAGRPPFDMGMLFKLLILQSLYSLSDDHMEFQITYRLSFKRFLGRRAAIRFQTARPSGSSAKPSFMKGLSKSCFTGSIKPLTTSLSLPIRVKSLTPASLFEVPRALCRRVTAVHCCTAVP
jgi:transposase, IS5 family